MMTKVLAVVLSCLCLAFANPIANPDCKKGPEFWCHSLSNAKSCDQVQYCHASVWKVPLRSDPRAKVDGALECTICEAIVKIVDSYVENNATEQEALAALENLCNDLGPIASLCTGLVDTYFPAIWNLLIKETDPATVCTEIGLCSALKTKAKELKVSHPQPKEGKVDGALECTICEAIVKLADSYVENNATEQEALAALENLCNSLGPIASLCTGLVDTYFPAIWNLLIQETDPTTVCTEIGLCSALKTKAKELKPKEGKVDGALECTICEAIVKIADSYVENNATEQEALAALENLCNDLGPIASLCTGLVDTYFPAIWALLIKETDPATVCTEIGLCSALKTKAKELKMLIPAKH
ncbi:hypothetical protein EMCRGX_G030785 [Ephydatia muelleri]